MKNSVLYSLAAATGLLLGSAIVACGLLPEKSVALEVFECECAALEPALGDVFDTAELVRDWYKGGANLFQVLIASGKTVDEAREILSRVAACDPRARAAVPAQAPTVLY